MFEISFGCLRIPNCSIGMFTSSQLTSSICLYSLVVVLLRLQSSALLILSELPLWGSVRIGQILGLGILLGTIALPKLTHYLMVSALGAAD